MDWIHTSEERFFGASDSETIQNAIDFAAAAGENRVVIPRLNKRTGELAWSIEKTILLPSGITVMIDNAFLCLADGVRENIFRNRNAFQPEGLTLDGEQHDIRILGIGNAVLSGGNPNGLSEQLHRDDPERYPHMSVNLLIFLHNVRDFTVSGLRVIDSRWWGLCFMYCRWGKISDINFRMTATVANQDGIDLRVGCEYITIENITGITGDDTIALTALPLSKSFEKKLAVEGKLVDIHDVTIRSVTASTHGCAVIRFLNTDGAKEYNITATDIKDTGEAIGGTGVMLGDKRYFCERPRRADEFRNIVIRNVSTSSQRGILLADAMKNVVIENVTTYGRNRVGIKAWKTFSCENLVIRDFNFQSEPEEADCVFEIDAEDAEAIQDVKIERVRARKAKYLFRCLELPVEDLRYEEPSEGYFTEEKSSLPGAYGRYHKQIRGREILNRPADNRFS